MDAPLALPWPARLLRRFPFWRRIPARLIGIGFRPEHVRTPEAGQIPYPLSEVGIPSKNRFNAGVSFNTKRFLGSASVNYSDKAFWTDVLSAPYWGYTDSYTMVNASLGVKLADGKVTAALKGTNLTNETIQQHIYGDILKISVAAEVRIFVK